MTWKFFRFPSTSPGKNTFFRVMRNKATSYVLTVQCPTELRSKAIEIKGGFFNSFRIVQN